MLPGSGCVAWMMGCMVKSPDRKGDDHGTAAARDVGPGRPRRAGTPLPHHPRRHHPHPLPDAAAARRRPSGPRGRPADLLQPRHGPPGPQALPGWWARRGAAPAPPGAAAPLPARLGARAGPGHRPGSARGGGRQCVVDVSAAGRLPGRADRASGGDRDGAGRVAPGGVCVQADLYLQDEVEVGLHPTLTRVWSRAGRSGQRLVQAPGKNFKRCGFGLVDWRDGHLDWALAEGRRAVPFCDQLRRAVARSRSRGRIAMVILDNLGIHTPKGSRLLRGLLAELGEDLVLVYTPTYDPDANRIEWLWRALRRAVTHTHRRQRLDDLLADADRWARTIPAAKVLSQIGSPFAPDQQPTAEPELNHAA